jgi:hypothetical protein
VKNVTKYSTRKIKHAEIIPPHDWKSGLQSQSPPHFKSRRKTGSSRVLILERICWNKEKLASLSRELLYFALQQKRGGMRGPIQRGLEGGGAYVIGDICLEGATLYRKWAYRFRMNLKAENLQRQCHEICTFNQIFNHRQRKTRSVYNLHRIRQIQKCHGFC